MYKSIEEFWFGSINQDENKPADSFKIHEPFKLPAGWHYWDEYDSLQGPFGDIANCIKSAGEPILIL